MRFSYRPLSENRVYTIVFTPSVSPPILAEYALTLARLKFSAVKPESIKQILAAIQATATLIEPRHILSVSADEPDNRFLECAETSGSDFLVTGNKRHFPPEWKGTRIVSARELLGALDTHSK